MGIIRRSFSHLDKSTFNLLFKSLVRPHIEYAHSVWYPTTKKLKTLIENVQRRATKQLPCCKDMEYNDRLKYLDLPCLAYRRIRGDIIEVYKMMNQKYDQELEIPLIPACKVHNRDHRNSQYTLHRSKIKTTARKLSFKNRVVHFWNELPAKVKEAPSIIF